MKVIGFYLVLSAFLWPPSSYFYFLQIFDFQSLCGSSHASSSHGAPDKFESVRWDCQSACWALKNMHIFKIRLFKIMFVSLQRNKNFAVTRGTIFWDFAGMSFAPDALLLMSVLTAALILVLDWSSQHIDSLLNSVSRISRKCSFHISASRFVVSSWPISDLTIPSYHSHPLT